MKSPSAPLPPGREKLGEMDPPLVSIVTPVLNRIKYLETCVQSVLRQGYPHLEHIFVDGCSSDGTVEMLSRYQAQYPERIRFISEPDKGAGEALNKGLRIAQGEILGILCSDDLYEPDAVRTVVEFFQANPGAYFVYGDLNRINEKGELIERYRAPDLIWEELINDFCAIPTPTAFFRRKVIEEIGKFNTQGNDLEYWIRTVKVFKTYRIEKVISNFRVHKEGVTQSGKSRGRWMREDFLVSLLHGGSIFSPRSKRYYRHVIFEVIKPKLGSLYPLIKKIGLAIRKPGSGKNPSP